MINNISFKAKYISDTTIKVKESPRSSYAPKTVSFVELDPHCANDVIAISNMAQNKDWALGDLTDVIAEDFVDEQENKKRQLKYFSILDDKNYKKINTKNLLGIIELEPNYNNKIHINFLQVNPKYINDLYTKKPPQMKNIGKALLSEICKLYCDKDITLNAVCDSKRFYNKLGFEPIYAHSNQMVLKAKKFLNSLPK